MLRKAAQLFRSRLRLSQPWRYKAPFLIAVPYFMVEAGHIPPREAAIGFAMSCMTIFGIAGFGYFLNDWTDRAEDAAAGKFNVMLELPKLAVAGLLLLFLGMAVVPWVVYFPQGISTLGLLGFEFLLFVLYSAPPFRFKERGWLGVFCDAGYAHAVPAVLAGITFYYLGDRSYAQIWWFLGTLGTWQGMVGIRNILLHMRQDFEKDVATGTATLGVKLGRERLERILVNLIIPLELLSAAAFIAFWLWELWPLSVWALLFPVHFLYAHRFIDKLPFPTRLEDRLTAFQDDFYVLWLPLLPLLTLSASNPWFLLLLAAHLLIFRNLLSELRPRFRHWNRTQRIKYAFLGAFVFLLGQFQAVELRGEFFPAFIFPMFKTVPPAGQPLTIAQPKILRHSKTTSEIPASHLLHRVAESHRTTVLRQHFGPTPDQQDHSPETEAWAREQTGGEIHALEIYWGQGAWSPGQALDQVIFRYPESPQYRALYPPPYQQPLLPPEHAD